MIVKAFIAGFGGQGVISLGFTLAYAAMLEHKQTTCFPSYGAEMRGGTANCTVAVGDEEIASPIASEPEFLVTLNAPSLARFAASVAPGGLILLNSTLIAERPTRANIECVEVPANELSRATGSERSANMVMLGALSAQTGIVGREACHGALGRIYAGKQAVRDSNIQGFDIGYEYMTKGQ